MVKFVYRHFAFLGDESIRAAEASECAAEQDKFWEYHDILFENWNGENEGAFADRNLGRFAREIGLDMDQFTECMQSRRQIDRVTSDSQAARDAGVRSTPTIFVNGKLIGSLRTYEDYKRVIDDELAGAN